MRGEGESALRMIGRAQAVESPQTAWKNILGKRIPLSPPAIPDASNVVVCDGLVAAQFCGKQSAQTE